MQTIKTLSEITIKLVVPREDAIRTALIIFIIPQAWLAQGISTPVMWYLSNLGGLYITPIISMSLYVLAVVFFLNFFLTFSLTIAATNGRNRLAYFLWYLVVVLLYLELYFIAFFSSYRMAFIKAELMNALGALLLNPSEENTRIMNLIQNKLDCCGAHGPDDYLLSSQGIPPSCCAYRDKVKFVSIGCRRFGTWYSTRGCADEEAAFMAFFPAAIASTLWKLAFFHFIMLALVFWYRVMTKEDLMDRLMNAKLMQEFPLEPKPNQLPSEPNPTTYYKTVYNRHHYMELMIKGESAGRWVPHYQFDKMRKAYPRLVQLKKRLNIL